MSFYLGLKIDAPWPAEMPKGQVILESQRHLKIADLPHFSRDLFEKLRNFGFTRQIGEVSYFDSCFLIPHDQPQEVRWKVHLESIQAFQSRLVKELSFLHPKEVNKENLSMLLCLFPSNPSEWPETFIPLPFKTETLHLYEHQGPSSHSLWTFSFLPPFEEEEHTADMAFKVHGENLQDIYRYAFTALAFKMPELLPFFIPLPYLDHLNDIVIALNRSVGAADAAIGCPLKAVSFHGDLIHLDPSTLQWEMIVDV